MKHPFVYDITFIGSGISCSCTLKNILESALQKEDFESPLKILIIEKRDEFWKGLPYGKQASENSLLITSLEHFLIDPELKSFVNWLEINKLKWMKNFPDDGIYNNWLAINSEHIRKGEWLNLYLPRRLYGDYIAEKMPYTITMAKIRGVAETHLYNGEVINLSKNYDGLFEIAVKEKENKETIEKIQSWQVVLSVGSPPNKPIANRKMQKRYIHDIYQQGIDENIYRVTQLINSTPKKDNKNILVIGSNAGCLEFLYLLTKKEDLVNIINKVVVISGSGLFPYRISETEADNVSFSCRNLETLKHRDKFSSGELIQATERDIDSAISMGINISYIADQLTAITMDLFNRMDENQQEKFVCRDGIKLVRLIRRAGHNYLDACNELMASNKLQIIKGKFLSLSFFGASEESVVFSYEQESQIIYSPVQFCAVVNCSGFEDMNNFSSSSALINSVTTSGLCKINKSGRGFLVNENFEAEDRLYIMGPLLAGAFNKRMRLWHAESASRINDLATQLGQIILFSIEKHKKHATKE